MNIYFAPLEGITGYLFRNAYEKAFPDTITKYFAPFISSGVKKGIAGKDLRQLAPENNNGLCLVPQLLTNDDEDFKRAAAALKDMGYDEINLNLGCPSQTVVSKGRGAGMLKDPELIDRFLESSCDFCMQNDIRLSVKTRVGFSDESEFPGLLEIFDRYPLSELIIHLRLRSDFYNPPCRSSLFRFAAENSRHNLVYNGDVLTTGNISDITQSFPGIAAVMMGRGLLMRPWILAGTALPDTGLPDQNASDPGSSYTGLSDEKSADLAKKTWLFHDDLYTSYIREMSGDRNVLFKMKELWAYLGESFDTSESREGKKNRKALKQIKKCQKLSDYESAVRILRSSQLQLP